MSWLRFRMDLTPTPKRPLIHGILALMEGANPTKTYKATSGISFHQDINAQDQKGRGPLPACKLVGIPSYFVRTTPFARPKTKGIKGNFYYIEPDPVTIEGIRRGEFGIHFDANVPGSAGCIVLPETEEWQEFEQFMRGYRTQGFTTISLIVEYNRPETTEALPPFTLDDPLPSHLLRVNQPTFFSGTSTTAIKKVQGFVDRDRVPEGFLIGETTVEEDSWHFSRVLVNTGKDRLFTFQGLGEDGKILHTQELRLTVIQAGQDFPTSQLSVTEPSPGEQRRIGRSVRFAGTCDSAVKRILITIGPGGPFTLGDVTPVNGLWEVQATILSPGIDRPLKFTALDSEGHILQTLEQKLSLVPGLLKLSAIPAPWTSSTKTQNHVPVLVQAFRDQDIVAPVVLAYAAASIGRESSWNERAVNTTDAAAQTGFPGAGLAQITWRENYKKVGDVIGVDLVRNPELMFDPLTSLRAKAAFYRLNRMIPFIEAGDYQSAAGLYNAGRATFRSSYTRNVAKDTPGWLPVFTP